MSPPALFDDVHGAALVGFGDHALNRGESDLRLVLLQVDEDRVQPSIRYDDRATSSQPAKPYNLQLITARSRNQVSRTDHPHQ
jgi:hypothetical protein